jgi:predicted PilT family ATPase
MSDTNDAAFHQMLRRIAYAVCAAMVETRMTVQEVAEKSGLPVGYVRKVLSAEAYGLTLKRLVMLEQAFDREVMFVPALGPAQKPEEQQSEPDA